MCNYFRIMWKKIITDLEALGITQREISLAAGVTQGAISQLKTGRNKDTTYSVGSVLIALHQQCCADLPAPALEEQEETE